MGIVNSSYVSDHTEWIEQQRARHPEWAEEQKTGRALWWDRRQEQDTVQRNAASRVAQKPYPYDVNFYGE